MKVILISGKARHGKDTVAEMMKEKLEACGKRVLVTHYADLLKYICRQYLGWDGNKDEKGRELLQYVGTDVVRAQRPDLWVDFMIMILGFFGDRWDYVIIPDCRFPNEVEKMKQKFDTVHFRVRRKEENTLSATQKQHASETALDDTIPDVYINNYDTLDMLRMQTDWRALELIESEASE